MYGAVSFGLGARWLALGLILVGIAVYAIVRFRRIPGLVLLAVLAIVTLFVIPLDLNLGSSAATQPPTCPWLSNSEVTTALGPGAVTSGSPTSAHCTWSSSPHPPAKGRSTTELSLVITYPTVMPSPTAVDQEVSTVGLRAWTSSACDLSTCSEALFVVLSRGVREHQFVLGRDESSDMAANGNPGRSTPDQTGNPRGPSGQPT